jgi:AcrR family transcriptional regulator
MNERPERRTPLNRDRVLRAAVALADREGVDAVSMRKLADELGVVPMALYKHVANKEDLRSGMVDVVISAYDPPEPSSDWKKAVRGRILSARRALLEHPWARRVIESQRQRTPTVLSYMDSLSGMFMAGGLSPDLTHHAMHALGYRIWGFSPEAFEDPNAFPIPDDPAERDEMIRQVGETYPHILRIAMAASGDDVSAVGRTCDEQYEFEFALDLLLDAVEQLHERGWNSDGHTQGSTGSRSVVETPRQEGAASPHGWSTTNTELQSGRSGCVPARSIWRHSSSVSR